MPQHQEEHNMLWSFRRYLPAIIRAKGRVVSICSKAIFMAAVKGTESSMPGMPHIQPQKSRDSNTVRGLKFSPFPIIFGSTKFPTTVCRAISTAKTPKVFEIEPN